MSSVDEIGCQAQSSQVTTLDTNRKTLQCTICTNLLVCTRKKHDWLG